MHTTAFTWHRRIPIPFPENPDSVNCSYSQGSWLGSCLRAEARHRSGLNPSIIREARPGAPFKGELGLTTAETFVGNFAVPWSGVQLGGKALTYLASSDSIPSPENPDQECVPNRAFFQPSDGWLGYRKDPENA